MKKQFNRILGIVCICFLSLGLFNSCQDDSELLALEQGSASSTDGFLKVDKLNRPTTSNLRFTESEKDIIYQSFTRIADNSLNEKGEFDPSRLNADDLNMDIDLFNFSFNFLKPYLEGKKVIGEEMKNLRPCMKTRTEIGGGDIGLSAEEWFIKTNTKEQICNMICNLLDSEFEKKCFKQYFEAKGNMEISADDWSGIKSAIQELNNFDEKGIVEINGQKRKKGLVSFYNNENYDEALGTATVFKTLTGEIVGLFDSYNFDARASRTLKNNFKVAIGAVCKMLGAEDYDLYYGDYQKS